MGEEDEKSIAFALILLEEQYAEATYHANKHLNEVERLNKALDEALDRVYYYKAEAKGISEEIKSIKETTEEEVDTIQITIPLWVAKKAVNWAVYQPGYSASEIRKACRRALGLEDRIL